MSKTGSSHVIFPPLEITLEHESANETVAHLDTDKMVGSKQSLYQLWADSPPPPHPHYTQVTVQHLMEYKHILTEKIEKLSAYLVNERSSCQDHGQLTGIVRVVQPVLVRQIPSVESTRKTNNSVPGFTPDSGK